MKPIIAILFFGTSLLYSIDAYSQTDNPVIIERHIENLSLLDENAFPKRRLINVKIESIWKEFDSLPTVTGIEYFENRYSRYYSNQTYNESFNFYLIAKAGDGDCAAGLDLIICKGNSIFSQKEVVHSCGWETGSTKGYVIFANDSVFTIITEEKMNPIDSNGMVMTDKYDCKKIVEKYKIDSNGGLILQEKSEDSWTEKK